MRRLLLEKSHYFFREPFPILLTPFSEMRKKREENNLVCCDLKLLFAIPFLDGKTGKISRYLISM